MSLAIILLLTTAFCGLNVQPAAAFEPIAFDFEDPASPLNEKWSTSRIDPGSAKVTNTTQRAKDGNRSLKIEGKLPEGFGVTYYPWRDWTGHTTLSFDLWVPPDIPKHPEGFDCWVYIKDQSYYWFQTPIYADPHTLDRDKEIQRGRWQHCRIDISEDSTVWQPGGHERSWDHVLYKPREFGIRFFGKLDWNGAVFLDNVALTGRHMPLGEISSQQGKRKTKTTWLQLTQNASQIPKYEKFEVTFNLAETYQNPFDPDVVDVQGHFVSPRGANIKVPGFYYQDYERSKTDEGFEKLIPIGAPCWKVRFAPRETGIYRYWVTVRDAAGELSSTVHTFQAVKPLHPRGFVRVSKQDPLYFEFDNGDWFWPIGINMRDGGDDAARQKGTYAFDQYFKRFHEQGIDLVRTWMCAWWAGIEWSDEYHSRFSDTERYNMYNAWRLDYCADLAKQYDIYLEITFNSHGQVRRDKFDEEWAYSPWNPRNGGFVASPAMFFSSSRVKEHFRNRYRYIVARWGYSRNIMAWDLWNEVDLVEGYDPGLVSAWHEQMAQYLRAIDPWNHIIVTHICLFWSFGDEMWRLPEIQFIQSDAYWDQKKDKREDLGMYASYLGKVNQRAGYDPKFQKPFIFVEYGPKTATVASGKVTPRIWKKRYRTGLWTSAVLPTAGMAMFWYHKQWDELELHQYQNPVQKLFADYDRRGKNLRMRPVVVTGSEKLKGTGMANDSVGFFYLHNPDNVGRDRSQIQQPTEGAKAMVAWMPSGQYHVQFIDTLTGQVTETTSVEIEPNRSLLKVPLPALKDDLLMKATRR